MPSWSRLFPGHPEQVAEARLFTRSVLLGRPESETAELVVSELATNALLHTATGDPGGAFTVSVTVTQDRVMLAVDDLGSPGEPVIRNGNGEPPVSGLGLVLVASLAKEWGTTRTRSGCRVWAELSGAA